MRPQGLRVAALLATHDADVVQDVRLAGHVGAGFVELQAAFVVFDGYSRVSAQRGDRPQVLVGVRARIVGARPFGALRRH